MVKAMCKCTANYSLHTMRELDLMKYWSSLFWQFQHSNLFKMYHHDDVIKWKHFPRYWPFVRGIHRSPVNSPHKGQWRGALIFSLICGWKNGWINNREAGDLRRYRAHYDVSGMTKKCFRIQTHWNACSLQHIETPVILTQHCLPKNNIKSYSSIITYFCSVVVSKIFVWL